MDTNLGLVEVQKLEGHTDSVWSVAWNPAGDGVLASCSGDQTVRIWEQSEHSRSWTCKAVLEYVHTRTVRSCAWSPSGKLLATSSFDGTSCVWQNFDSTDPECVSVLQGHESEVKSVSWNASGSLLATCGKDKSVWIWEILPKNEFDCAAVLSGHRQDVKMVQWHPTMDVLFSCSYDNTIKVWLSEDGYNCVQTLSESNNGHSSTVWAISFNAARDRIVTCRDGVIASGASDDTIRLFVDDNSDSVDRPLYKLLLKKEKAHEMDVNSVQWAPDHKEIGLLASASDVGMVKIWKLALEA